MSGDVDDDEDAIRKPAYGKIIGISLVVLLLVSLPVLYFGKDMVIDQFGAAEDLYKMVGLGPKPGEGLDIRPAKPIRKTENGIEVLSFSGVIQNISKRVRPVPMIYAVLSDADQNVLQTASSAPIKSELKPDERLKFKISVSYPAPLARDARVTFRKPESAEDPKAVEKK